MRRIFLGFLQKSVPHESLTLDFEPFQFLLRNCGDIRKFVIEKRLPYSGRLPVDTIFFKPLNKSMVIVHNIHGLFSKLVL